jgi:hypothetical protein
MYAGFIRCRFRTLRPFIPLVDSFTIGGNSLVIGGVLQLTSCSISFGALFGVGAIIGGNAVLGGAGIYTWTAYNAAIGATVRMGSGFALFVGGTFTCS